MTLVAGIDASTQGCKVVVCEIADGRVVREGRASHPADREIDPERWWTSLQEAIAAAGGIDDVAAVSVAGQQHGLVPLDVDGEVIRPAMLWHDTRAAAAAAVLVDEVGADAFVARTSVVPVASFTASKARWLADEEPEHAARIAAIALPHDWLTWRLRGYGPRGASEHGPVLDELVTDRSDASGTAYFDPTTSAYDVDLLSRALRRDASGIVLPRVLAPDASVRGLRDVVVGAGAGDNAGAALGLGAVADDVCVSIGTSGTVYAVAETPAQDPTGTVAGFADAAGGYLPLITTLNAARVLDATATLLGVDHGELGRLALAAPPGSGGLVLQPWFEGERTPNLPDATATLFGMTLASTTREGLARAAVEGVLCSLAEGLDAVRAHGARASRALLIGGAAQSAAVQRVAAQVLGTPIVVPEPGEYVARGAAVQAAWALTGERPTWPLAIAAELDADPWPIVREQYAARR